MYFASAIVALVFDRFLPGPSGFYRIFGHPVVWIGGMISALEHRLNDPALPDAKRRTNGMVMLAIVLIVSLLAAGLLRDFLRIFPFSWVLEGLVASVFLAHRELKQAVLNVADQLDVSLDAGRKAVSHIVGRDTAQMPEEDVSRAAIESLAENSSDGVIAPLFWMCVLGLPGLVAYKAINTADSMVGHKNERYLHFGWASATFDDVVNWIPARLTALAYALASWFAPGTDPKAAWNTATSDAPNHTSPNAGWPEAAMAGALGFSLGGRRAYRGSVLDLPQMGSGRRNVTTDDIRRSVRLYDTMASLALVLVLVLGAIT